LRPGQSSEPVNGDGAQASGIAHLLLVEHHLSFRTAIAFMIDREPDLCVSAHAGSIAEARELLPEATGQIDVALVGLHLPDGNGIELVELIHARHPHCQIIALTSLEDRREHANAIASGAAGVLHKSVSIEEIVAAIRRAHRGQSLHPPDELIALLRLATQYRAEEQVARASLERLTPRERQILMALADGLSDKEIAARLHVSVNTVAAHMVSVLGKLGVHSRLQAVLLAIKHGIVTLR
jgi:DNA-binding NarL/FixJ family response regulator